LKQEQFSKKKKKFGGFAESVDMFILEQNRLKNVHPVAIPEVFIN
jgi:hypothetical protein